MSLFFLPFGSNETYTQNLRMVFLALSEKLRRRVIHAINCLFACVIRSQNTYKEKNRPQKKKKRREKLFGPPITAKVKDGNFLGMIRHPQKTEEKPTCKQIEGNPHRFREKNSSAL